MIDFMTVWENLQQGLLPGTIVKNWTAYRGYLGDTITVIQVSWNSITVDAPKAETLQVVPKADFEHVWQVWEDYKRQKVKRYELRDMARFSKYIISILHWYEEE